MTLQVRNVHHSVLEHFLQGGIVGGKVVQTSTPNLYLHGKTLVFNNPVGLVGLTSTGGQQTPLSLQEVKTQIEAAVAVVVTFPGGKLFIKEAALTTGVDLTAGGSANPSFGFGATTATVGIVYNAPGGALPALVGINQVGDGYLQVITDE